MILNTLGANEELDSSISTYGDEECVGIKVIALDRRGDYAYATT